MAVSSRREFDLFWSHGVEKNLQGLKPSPRPAGGGGRGPQVLRARKFEVNGKFRFCGLTPERAVPIVREESGGVVWSCPLGSRVSIKD